MVTASTHAIAVAGIEGHVIRIDAAITSGAAGLVATGLPGTTVRRTADRVRAAIINSGHAWPDGQITVAVGPAGMPNRGSSLDLGIAFAILAAAGTVMYLSRRVVVMTSRPGRISAEFQIDAAEPRGEEFRTSAEYAAYCREVSIGLTHAAGEEAVRR